MARKNANYEGRRVRLRYDIETRGGEKFPKGSICEVRYVHRGKLTLRMRNPDPNNIFGPKYLAVRCVQTWEVELLSLPGEKPAEDD